MPRRYSPISRQKLILKSQKSKVPIYFMNHQQFSVMPETSNYWLKNAHVPGCLIERELEISDQTRVGLSLVDIEIKEGVITQIVHSLADLPSLNNGDIPRVDLKGGMVWPCRYAYPFR